MTSCQQGETTTISGFALGLLGSMVLGDAPPFSPKVLATIRSFDLDLFGSSDPGGTPCRTHRIELLIPAVLSLYELRITHTHSLNEVLIMKFRHLVVLAGVPLLIPLGNALTQLNTHANVAVAEPAIEAPELIAQAPSGPEAEGERPRRGRRGRWLEELDLTPEQRDAIRAIRREARPTKQDLRQQLQQERETMRSLLSDSNTSRDQLRSQHQTLMAARQQMANQRFEMMLDIREELTPEQRAKLAELKVQRRGRHGRRFKQFR